MGKIRVATLGSEEEKEQKRRADARRQTKKSKKEKVEGVGLKGGERVAVVEGADIKPEYKKLVEEVQSGAAPGASEEKKPRQKKARQRSKRYQEALKLIDRTKRYALPDAIERIKKTSLTRFDGTVQLHLTLNPATLGDKKDLRGSVQLPHATGKTTRVAIADDALLSKIEKGNIDFDILVTHPSMMPKLAKFARILGPKGLMPNPKAGTIGENPEKIAESLTKGKVNFKTDPDQAVIHIVLGKVSHEGKKIEQNAQAAILAVGKAKILRATLSATMGPGVKIAL